MITVDQALKLAFELVQPLSVENIPLANARNRILATTVSAIRDQPPFSSSAMDGYAVRNADVAPGATFNVIGESAAGHRFDGKVSAGQTVRIFTGAPVPPGSDRIIIQEDTIRDGNTISLTDNLDTAFYIRPAGTDFKSGSHVKAPRRLRANDLALLAAMNIATVPVARKPVIALLATGDELAMPGEIPGTDQIIASNCFGLAALAQSAGAEVRMLPIARDTKASLLSAFELAKNADLIVTIGGASVGDHDLVGDVARDLGMDLSFYKIAMRPGKPLMAGKLGGSVLLGLPGNPVSSMVCGHIFMVPMILAMLGLPPRAAERQQAVLAAPVEANGGREHYMRANVSGDQITVFQRQDSALLSVLTDANALVVRPIDDPARETGEMVEFIHI